MTFNEDDAEDEPSGHIAAHRSSSCYRLAMAVSLSFCSPSLAFAPTLAHTRSASPALHCRAAPLSLCMAEPRPGKRCLPTPTSSIHAYCCSPPNFCFLAVGCRRSAESSQRYSITSIAMRWTSRGKRRPLLKAKRSWQRRSRLRSCMRPRSAHR